MFRDGAIPSVTSVRDFYGGVDRTSGNRRHDHHAVQRGLSGTRGHGLRDKIYNGYGAEWVSSKGALKNSVKNGADGMAGGASCSIFRGRSESTGSNRATPQREEVQAAADRSESRSGEGDFVFVRTGAMTSAVTAAVGETMQA